MKVIKNNYIPFEGFKAINLFGVIFQRNGTKDMSKIDLNHEAIHTAQMKELGYIFFYIIYFIEWFGRWVLNVFDNRQAYKNISFEKEAYNNQRKTTYLSSRKHYAQWRK